MRIAALDIGGTSVKSGLWTGEEVTELREHATNAKNGGHYVMDRAVKILHQYRDFDAIGISTAGQVNSEEGIIRYANENIPEYTGMRVREILEKEFGVPVAVENDVNAAAIGEAQFGAGRAFKDFICITYGTGVGGAIVMDKEIYTGSSFSAGEFGGIMVHPEDSVYGEPFCGCYEKYASTTALVRKAMEYNRELDNGRKIFSRLDDPNVRDIINCWIDEIVYGLITVTHIFNPACIVLGGGVMSQPYILEEVKMKTTARIMSSFRNLKLLQAELGNRAGLMGAAYLAEKLEKQRRDS